MASDTEAATGVIEGTYWAPGAAPVHCTDCGADLELGERCDHLAHTEDGLTLVP